MGQSYGSRWFFGLALALLGYGSYLVIKPFASALISGIVLAFIVLPLYRFTLRKLRSEALSAFLISTLVVLLLTIPLVFSANSLVRESNDLYNQAKTKVLDGTLIGFRCPEDSGGTLCWLADNTNEVLQNPQVMASIAEALRTILKTFTGDISALLLSIPTLLLAALVALLTMFFTLKEGPIMLSRARKLIPIDRKHTNMIFDQVTDVIYGVLYGFVLTALMQGVLGGLGFWIFGISHPVFWGIVMTIAAFLPIIGTWFVWVPAAIIQISAGSAAGDSAMMWGGIGFIIYSIILIQPIDWLLKPYLIGSHARVHTLLIFLGVLGGIIVFGPVGFVIGPLLLALLKTLLEIYEFEIHKHRPRRKRR